MAMILNDGLDNPLYTTVHYPHNFMLLPPSLAFIEANADQLEMLPS